MTRDEFEARQRDMWTTALGPEYGHLVETFVQDELTAFDNRQNLIAHPLEVVFVNGVLDVQNMQASA